MQRDEQQEELVDLGSVSAETKGLPMGEDDDVFGPRVRQIMGLSDD